MYIEKRKIQPKRTHVQQISLKSQLLLFFLPNPKAQWPKFSTAPTSVSDRRCLRTPVSHPRKFFSPDTSCDLLVAAGAGSSTSAPGWQARRHGGVPCPCAALWLCPGPASCIWQGGDRQQRAIRESVCRNFFQIT
jgi:hypothetical protein